MVERKCACEKEQQRQIFAIENKLKLSVQFPVLQEYLVGRITYYLHIVELNATLKFSQYNKKLNKKDN